MLRPHSCTAPGLGYAEHLLVPRLQLPAAGWRVMQSHKLSTWTARGADEGGTARGEWLRLKVTANTLQPLWARTCQAKPVSWAQLDTRDCTTMGAGGGGKALTNTGQTSQDPKGFQPCETASHPADSPLSAVGLCARGSPASAATPAHGTGPVGTAFPGDRDPSSSAEQD